MHTRRHVRVAYCVALLITSACKREPRPEDSSRAAALRTAASSTTAAPGVGAVVTRDSSVAPDSLFEPKLETVKSHETTCYTLAHWFVVARETEDVGSDVIVRKRDAATTAPLASSCGFDSLPGDYVVRNVEAEYFAGIRGHWLFLESGTGPQSSWVIHDLTARRKAGVIEADEIVRWRDSSTLTLWLRADTVPHAKCPETPPSLVAGSDSLVDYDLNTGKHTSIGKWRCAVWQ